MTGGAFLAMFVAIRARKRSEAELEDLRSKLKAERLRWEWARSVRMRHYVTLECLKRPEDSPWMETWLHGSDTNFLSVTSLTRSSFCLLMERFAPFYHIPQYSLKGGRPPKLKHHHQVLGLLLSFYVGSMQNNQLCFQFGAPPATVSRVINVAEAALSEALVGFKPARIVWPSLVQQQSLAKLVSMKQPLLSFTWGFLDGKNYRVQSPSDRELQNAHYNGWLHSVFVTGTICFSADGLIVWAKHNCPGSGNDGDTCLAFRKKLVDVELNPDQRYGIVADSAFPCGGVMKGRIMTPLKEGNLQRLVPSVREVASDLSAAITSIRQSAEWGMGSIEKVFHSLLQPLPFDKEKRRVRLEILFRLANYRVRTVGISEIRTAYFHGQTDLMYAS